MKTVPFLALFLLTGCSLLPWGDGKPGPVRVTVVAGSRLNPDDQGRSLPTAVRVFQVASTAKASQAELIDLVRDPKEALGEDLKGIEELLLQPGERVERTIAREKETQALLVVGLFRRPTGSGWKQLVELRGRGSARLAFSIDEYRLERR